jgi:hypothetical protein
MEVLKKHKNEMCLLKEGRSGKKADEKKNTEAIDS